MVMAMCTFLVPKLCTCFNYFHSLHYHVSIGLLFLKTVVFEIISLVHFLYHDLHCTALYHIIFGSIKINFGYPVKPSPRAPHP